MLVALLLLAGCIQPPARNQERDRAISESTEKLSPDPRQPVDATRIDEDDDIVFDLETEVRLLASEHALTRIQANNRLRQAGNRGIMAAARFLAGSHDPKELAEAIRFLSDASLNDLGLEELAEVRAMLAHCLDDSEGYVRAQASRALQIHGPGEQRTRFLQAIGDPERRVRWGVVRRFGDYPRDLNRAQRLILIGFLESRTRTEFMNADTANRGYVTRAEFPGSAEEFRRLDRNRDGAIQLEEWISPVESAVRADVVQLLQRLHVKLTPGAEPIGYNPYAPSADQLESVTRWKRWSDQLAD